ncbi:MAG TPA: NAD(P)/FAD-dependent oxidoreductase [Candidatus Dormibacteraeota bacterium]|jgi:pyruvate/2-oxoglutarate dehydrogenase complex dihydrolipoamide dehydrogenase (E3) component|nr:NAD(P)/FAD-dependent oxidoreductase [Candidatus Dormibacteraeota bacterium]
MPEEFDVVCIGAGPAGEGLASELKGSGLTLAVVEANKVGGECPYWGCVPSKTMLRSAEVLAEAGRAIEFSVSEIDYTVDYGKIRRRVLDSARGLDDTKSAKGMEATGARLVRGEGRLTGPRTAVVGDTELVARKAVVIATGTQPAVPDLPGLDSVDFWTNREVLFAPEQPASMIVLGAGPAGVEIGQAFQRFGTSVTMIENAPRVLSNEEPEAGDYLQGYLHEEGMNIICNCGVDKVEPGGDGIVVHRSSADAVTAERLLVSVGRKPNSEGLDAAAAGIKIDKRGFVEVDNETLEAGDGIYAAGDINGIGGFTHLSDYHGHVIGRRIKGLDARANHVAIPRVTYCDPEVASVGISEAQARENGINVKVVHGDVANDTRGWIHGKPGGVIKVIADADRRVLVGASLVGPRSGELLNEMSLALRTDASLDLLADLIHPFPSFGRIFQYLFHELAS